jgi:hypothetical protein
LRQSRQIIQSKFTLGVIELGYGSFAHHFNVITNQRRDTGLINEQCVWVIFLDNFADRFIKTFFTTVNHIQLVDVGRKTGAVKL